MSRVAEMGLNARVWDGDGNGFARAPVREPVSELVK